MPLEIFPEMTAKQAREDRIYIRLWVARVLFLIAVAVLVVIATKAYAEEIPVHVYEDGGTTIRLMPGPCADQGSLMMIVAAGAAYVERAKAIESVWRYRDGSSRPHAGCWIELSKAEAGEETFFLIFDDGQRIAVPKSEFLKKPEQGGA